MHTPLLRFPLVSKLCPTGRPFGLLAGVLLAGLAAAPAQAQTQTIFGLNRATNTLVKTTVSPPAGITTPTLQSVTGLATGQRLVGLDSRPATGQLFGLAYDGVGTAQVYIIDKNAMGVTATATPAGAAIALALGAGFEGIGFDFNPTVDRIRVTSAVNRASFRLNPNNGAQVDSDLTMMGLQADGPLNFPAGSPFAGQTAAVGSVAYTNSFIGATSTVLYDIDESRSTLFIQNLPNAGTLTVPVTITNASGGGNLLLPGDQTDFDIYTDPDTRIQVTLLTRTRGTFPAISTTFYQLDLLTGVATELPAQVALPNGVSVDDIAIGIDRTAPAASGRLLYAVTATNNLVSFNSDQPEFLLSAVPITGIPATQTLVGTDFRPNTGQLFGLGYDASLATANARLYIIDRTTGIATPVGPVNVTLELGTDAAALNAVGFDFNPTVDRIRVTGLNGKSYRLNPNNSAVAGTDTNLSFVSGATGTPAIGAVAYTNSYVGSTSTRLYDIDGVRNQLFVQGLTTNPNLGQLSAVNDNPLFAGAAGSRFDLDIFADVTTQPAATNTAFAVSNSSGSATASTFSTLYTVDLASATTSSLGVVGLGVEVRDISAFLTGANATAMLGGRLLYGVAGGNLVSFDSSNPGVIRTAVNITGLPSDGSQVLAGVDFRPATGELFALGYDAPGQNGQLYTLNISTGALTLVGNLQPMLLGTAASGIGFDFNPTVDRIRIVSATNQANLRVDPSNGSITTDTNVSYLDGSNNPIPGSTPAISGSAYTNNDNNANTGTMLYGYDQSTNQLVRATLAAGLDPAVPTNNAANLGTYRALGSSGLTVNPGVDFDIFADLTDPAVPANTGFLSASVGAGNTFDNLYAISLGDGSVSAGQRIGSGSNLTGLAAFLVPGPVINLAGFTWTGAVSTDWGTAGNWSGGTVPTAANDVTIPNTANDPVVSNAQQARAVTLGAGATLTTADGGTLTVNGNFANNGGTTLGAGSGTIAFAGSANRVISGSVTFFNNLSAGPAGVTALAPVQVQRLLTLNGNLVSNGNLTLLSDDTNTAMVFNNPGLVTGMAVVQRAISAAPNTFTGVSYRHYSSPVASSTVGDLATAGFTPVVNPAYNTDGNTVTPFPNVFSYDQNRVDVGTNPVPQDFDKGFLSPNTLGDGLVVGRGYTVNISAAAVVDFRGTLNNGNFTRTGLGRNVPVAQDPNNASGWHLMGNPYPSPIDADGLVLTGMDAAVYVSRATGPYAGTYRSTLAGSDSDGGNDELAVGQGFFVRTATPGVAGSVGFTNAARLTTYASPLFQRGAATSPLVRLDLTNAAGQADDLTVYFEEAATAGFDSQYDAYKLQGGSPVLLAAEVGATTLLAIDALPAFTGADMSVKLRLQAKAGAYTLRAADLLRLPAGMNVLLRDAQTGTVTDLTKQPSYSFQLSGNSTGRFTLLFSTQGALANAPAALSQQVTVFPNPARGSVFINLPAALSRQATGLQLVNALGQTVRRATLPAGASSQSVSLSGVAQGVYTLRLETAQGAVTKRLVVE